MLSTGWLCSLVLLQIAASCQAHHRVKVSNKIYFSSIDGDDGMNLDQGFSAQDIFPLFGGFMLTHMNEQIVDPIEGWTFLCASN
jgi:hypothetical protein